MSDSVRPHRWQPTRPCRPWDSPGKNTGVGCHFLLQCMKVKSESEVAQSSPTLSDPMDCSLPGSSVHGIFQARVLEWGAIAFSPRTCEDPVNKQHLQVKERGFRRNQPCQDYDFGLLASKTVGGTHICCLSSLPPSLQYFLMAALAKHTKTGRHESIY